MHGERAPRTRPKVAAVEHGEVTKARAMKRETRAMRKETKVARVRKVRRETRENAAQSHGVLFPFVQ